MDDVQIPLFCITRRHGIGLSGQAAHGQYTASAWSEGQRATSRHGRQGNGLRSVGSASFVRGLKRVSCPVCSQPVLEAAHGPLPGFMGGAGEAFPGCA
jgi:hypothetical protein